MYANSGAIYSVHLLHAYPVSLEVMNNGRKADTIYSFKIDIVFNNILHISRCQMPLFINII